MVRFHQLLALILLLAVTASGQVVTTDAGALTSRVWGATVNAPWYLRTIVVQGATPLDLTDRYVSFTVRQVDTEALVHSSTGTIHVVNPGEVIFTWTPRAPGTFTAAAQVRRVDTGQVVANILYDTITATNPPTAGAAQVSVISTSVVDLGNLTAQWEVQGDGDLAPDSTDRTIVPHTDLGSSLGKTNERFDEAHIDEGYFGTIRAGTVDVETAVGFLDNTKVKKSGETETVDLTNTSVQVRSPTNDTEAATKAYVDGLSGGASYLDYIGSYTYTGGEMQVTVAWTQQYELIKMKMDGALMGANGTNVSPDNGLAWAASVNGLANGHRAIFIADQYADAYPASTRTFNNITNTLMLMFVPATNSASPFAYRMWGVGEWEFISSAQGVHMSGSGHMFSGPLGNQSFWVHGGVSDYDDWTYRNVVTQLVFGIYNVTNGAAFAAHTSNAIVRLWGLKQ